jgi:hypothetical protein
VSRSEDHERYQDIKIRRSPAPFENKVLISQLKSNTFHIGSSDSSSNLDK